MDTLDEEADVVGEAVGDDASAPEVGADVVVDPVG